MQLSPQQLEELIEIERMLQLCYGELMQHERLLENAMSEFVLQLRLQVSSPREDAQAKMLHVRSIMYDYDGSDQLDQLIEGYFEDLDRTGVGCRNLVDTLSQISFTTRQIEELAQRYENSRIRLQGLR